MSVILLYNYDNIGNNGNNNVNIFILMYLDVDLIPSRDSTCVNWPLDGKDDEVQFGMSNIILSRKSTFERKSDSSPEKVYNFDRRKC